MFSAGLPLRSHADAFPDTIRFDGFEPCGLQCLRPQCPGNGTTSLSGTIYAPNATLPLPNVEVYIPNAGVDAFVDGPNAPRCDQAPSGHPLVATLTDANGNFVLNDVPATTGVPVVVLAGKWRRQLTVDIPACTNTPLDVTKTRLPKDHTEGDIAHMAVVTGSADAIECMMRKTGIADSEFSTSSGSGRIHLFAGASGNATSKFDVTNGGASFASGSTLWASSSTLGAYDQIVLGCDGSANPSGAISQNSLDAMQAYADAGGRVYLAHWNNYWLQSIAAWPVATWDNTSLIVASPTTAQVASDFPQAVVESQWLYAVGASATVGTLSIVGGRQTALTIDTTLAHRWIYMTANSKPSIQLFTFTTPVANTPGTQYGRVLFTDMHDSSDSSSSAKSFPSGCTSSSTALTPQEKALVYATFDLQRCVGSTKE